MNLNASVVDVVGTMQATCRALEAEIAQINVDLRHQQDCSARYSAELFSPSVQFLVALRDAKKAKYRQVIDQLERLTYQINNSSTLLTQLGADVSPARAASVRGHLM